MSEKKKRGRPRDGIGEAIANTTSRNQLAQAVNRRKGRRKRNPEISPQKVAATIAKRHGGYFAALVAVAPEKAEQAAKHYLVHRANTFHKSKQNRFIITAAGDRVPYWDARISDHRNQRDVCVNSSDTDLVQIEIQNVVIKFLEEKQKLYHRPITPRMFKEPISEIWHNYGRTPPEVFDIVQ